MDGGSPGNAGEISWKNRNTGFARLRRVIDAGSRTGGRGTFLGRARKVPKGTRPGDSALA